MHHFFFNFPWAQDYLISLALTVPIFLLLSFHFLSYYHSLSSITLLFLFPYFFNNTIQLDVLKVKLELSWRGYCALDCETRKVQENVYWVFCKTLKETLIPFLETHLKITSKSSSNMRKLESETYILTTNLIFLAILIK